MTMKRVLSGIRATGRLHLGNYFGMVEGMVNLQSSSNHEPFFMVADLHATTTPFKPEDLKKNTREVVLDYLAAELDPKKATLFIQSQVSEHIELAYLFSTVVSIARLTHLPTYKDKVKQYPQNNTVALLFYPVLMASDILLYKTEELPVGDDQLPHLEVANEIAKRMNDLYGTDFPEVKQIKTEGHYIPSLTGEGKMSKSVEGSFINLTDNLETIKSKLAKVPTDSGTGYIENGFYLSSRSIQGGSSTKNIAPSNGVKTLMILLELLEGKSRRTHYESLYGSTGIKYSELKEELSEAIYKKLKPIQERRVELEKNSEYVDQILKEGSGTAREVAQKTVREVKEKMGLI